MEFGADERLRERLEQLVDSTVGEWPPRRLVKLLFALAGNQTVLASLGSVAATDAATSWRLFALTAKRLILVEGEAQVGGWRWESKPVEDAQESARSLPLSEVRTITVESLSEQRLGFGESNAWTSDYCFELGDEHIALPKATTLGSASQRDAIERFALKLIELTT